MPPKKKKGTSRKSSTTATRAPDETESATSRADHTRVPLETPSAEQNAAPDMTDSSRESKEAALLFWLGSALRRFSTDAPTKKPTADVEVVPGPAVPSASSGEGESPRGGRKGKKGSKARQSSSSPKTKSSQNQDVVVVDEENAEADNAAHAPERGPQTTTEDAQSAPQPEDQQSEQRQGQQEQEKHVDVAQPHEQAGENAPAAAEPHTSSAQSFSFSSSSSSAPLRDVLPVFDALVEGQLGDVALDMWMNGQVSLTQHPDAFARLLDDHEQAASGPLRALLNGVTTYFLVRGESFYTMDTSAYPALPLIALLLQSSRVRKIVLHAPLLYKLLFMYLGTDKVDIANVVDLGAWFTTARQGSSVLANSPALEAITFDMSTNTLSTAALRSALPHEAQQLLAIDIANTQRRLMAAAAAAQSASRVDASAAVEEQRDASVVRATDSSSADTTSSDDEEKNGEPNEKDVPKEGDEESASADEVDALGLLRQLEPCGVDSDEDGYGGQAGQPRRRRRRRQRTQAGNALLLPMGAEAVTRTVEVFTGIASVYRFYEMVVEPEVRSSSSLPPPVASTSASTAAAAVVTSTAEVCARRTYAIFLCSLLSYHGFFISRTRFEAMMSDLDEQINALAEEATNVLEGKPSASSSSSSVAAAATAPPDTQPTGLLLALSAQEVIEYVQTQLVDEAQRKAVEATLQKATAQTGHGEARLSARHVELCLEALQGFSGGATRAAIADPPQNEESDRVHEMGNEQDEMMTVRVPEEATEAVRLRSCALARLWLAVQERRVFKKLLSMQWSGNNATLQARVLSPAPAVAAAAATTTLEATTRSVMEAAAAGDALPLSTLSYSVHPHWEMHLGTTGRIFASRPNVQTVPKVAPAALYPVSEDAPNQQQKQLEEEEEEEHGKAETSHASEGARTVPRRPDVTYPMLRHHPDWTLRHLYIAPPGCTLISLDFNQVELRVLAHLSQDPTLIAQLTHGTDVLGAMAQTVLRVPQGETVQPWQRQAMKVIVYGLLYGMGPELMTVRLAQLTTPVPQEADPSAASHSALNEHAVMDGAPQAPLQAKELLDDFYASYPQVRQYLLNVRATALHHRTVLTLSGVKHLTGSAHQDPNHRRQAAVAWAIQGGAADLLHIAMQRVHQQRHALISFLPASPLALVAVAHDELIYAVPSAAAPLVLPRLRAVMEVEVAKAVGLRVPLRVTARVGPSLGELQQMHDE